MMPGIGFEEMVIFALLAIVVIGPKDLPLMMRKFGRFTGKMRAMAFEFKQGFDELGRQAELDELRKEVANLKQHTGLDDLQREFREDQMNLDRDVRSALTAPTPAHPAAGAAAAAVPAVAAPAPYAGLSADHPGYDAGEDFRIDGAPPLPVTQADPAAPAEPAPEPAAQVNGVEAHDDVHVVPDDEVRPSAPPATPVKQDAPA